MNTQKLIKDLTFQDKVDIITARDMIWVKEDLQEGKLPH